MATDLKLVKKKKANQNKKKKYTSDDLADIRHAEKLRWLLTLIETSAYGAANDGKPENFDVLVAIGAAAEESRAALEALVRSEDV